MPSFIAKLISSEESADEDEGQFLVRPLHWRSEKVDDLFATLDRKYRKRQTIRSKKVSFERMEGLPSDRPKPQNETLVVQDPVNHYAVSAVQLQTHSLILLTPRVS